MKQVSFSALQQMAKEFDELDEAPEEGAETFVSAMDFYLYVVDNYEAVEEEVRTEIFEKVRQSTKADS